MLTLQDMESKLCVHLIARHGARSVSVLIVSMVLLLLSGPILVKGQGPFYLFGKNVTLPCLSTTSSTDEQFTWSDQTETAAIYIINGPGETEKTFDGRNNQKYANFYIDNNYPDNVNLLIKALEVKDAGMYACTFKDQAAPDALTVNVEAIPTSVSISCERKTSTDCSSPSSSESNAFSCNCTAIGAYPRSLQFEWSSGATVGQQTRMNNTERNGTFDFYTDAEIAPTENPGSVTCTLDGYEGNWREEDRNAVYNFNPPMCELKHVCNDTNTGVSLTCTCTDASPDEGLVYSFFKDGELLSSEDTNVFETAIEMGQEYTFGCRGCNGVNYGSASYVTQMVTCQETTESTTEEPKPTPTKKQGGLTTGAKIGISLGAVAVVVVIVVVAVILWKNGEDDSKPSDSSVADGNVTATNVNITSSEPPAPVYGVVKKDSKKKSDKLDDNGAGPRGDPEIPAYGVVDKNRTKDPTPAPRSSMRDSKNPSNPKQDGPLELQYAALDHGNKPPSDEVRKPKEEPTEYATVQSVIV